MNIRKEKIILLFLLLFIFYCSKAETAMAENTVTDFDEKTGEWIVKAVDAPNGTPESDKIVIWFDVSKARPKDGKEGDYIFHGKHRQSDATISYRTVGYNLSLESAKGGAVSTLIEQGKVEQITTVVIDGGRWNGEMHTTYQISTDDMHTAIYNLLYKKYQKEGHKDPNQKTLETLMSPNGVDFYISNIFRPYDRKTTGEFVRWRKDAFNDLSGIQGAEDWNLKTRDYYLPHYFNVKMHINPTKNGSDLYYKIVYEDIDGTELMTAKPKEGVIQNMEIVYDLFADAPDGKLVIDGKAYQFAKSAVYNYVLPTKKDYDVAINGSILRLKHIKAADGILRIQFKPAYMYNVVYLDKNKDLLAKVLTGQAVFKGETVSFTIPPSIMKNGMNVNGKLYQFNNEASYMYSEGNKPAAKVDGGTVSATHKQDGNATLRIIFKEGVPTQAPVITQIPIQEHETKTPINIKYMEAKATGKLGADTKGYEQFDVLRGIPTTESLYGVVRASEYLCDITFHKVEGAKTYVVQVEKPYNLTWTETDFLGNESEKSETKSVQGVVYISREYSYYEIASIVYYKLDGAGLRNYALPEGALQLTPAVGFQIPELVYNHYEGRDAHLKKPEQLNGIIKLPAGTGDTSIPPVFDPEEFKSEVDAMIGQIEVRNDALTFGGAAVLTDAYTATHAPAINTAAIKEPAVTKDTVLFASGKIIEATKANGIYPSSGTITYTQLVNFRTSMGSKWNAPIQDVNSVTIHTSVYCVGQLINDNKKYVQLINPESNAAPVVLDTESISNDFTVQISNEGSHRAIPGYGIRDYKKYVLKNQVKFPFDVYRDIGSDHNDANDTLLPANTWYTVTNGERFSVPMWVKEDIYTGILFRSIAINGEGKESLSEMNANLTLTNYVAWDSKWVQVSGKVYGLTLYDINDELWKPVFRKYQSLSLKRNLDGTDGTPAGKTYNRDYIYDYTVGTSNQYGLSTGRSSRFTFPLIAGSHPHEINQGVSKAGYIWRFTLKTTGSEMMEDASHIKIKPRFFYIDKNGNNREEVDLYYSGKIDGVQKNLVKVGSELDDKNSKTVQTNNIGLAIPESELKLTAAIRSKTYTDWLKQKNTMYTYGSIQTRLAFKTFSNSAYTADIRKRPNASAVKTEDNDIGRRKQSYYFNYSLPNSFQAVKKGTDLSGYQTITYKEPFWKKNGYILINFEITCYDKDGNAYLSINLQVIRP